MLHPPPRGGELVYNIREGRRSAFPSESKHSSESNLGCIKQDPLQPVLLSSLRVCMSAWACFHIYQVICFSPLLTQKYQFLAGREHVLFTFCILGLSDNARYCLGHQVFADLINELHGLKLCKHYMLSSQTSIYLYCVMCKKIFMEMKNMSSKDYLQKHSKNHKYLLH